MRQRTLSPLAIAIISSAMFIAGCSDAEQSAPQQAQQQQTVGVVTLASQSLELSTKLPGRATAYRSAEVRPQVSGILQEQLFTEGTDVEAGQSLYRIDPAIYKADLASAEAAVAQAEATLSAATARFNRFQDLLADKAISQQEFDEAEAAYLEAQAQLKVAEAQQQRAAVNLEYTAVKAPISGRIGRSVLTEGALVSVGQSLPLTTIHQLDPIYVDIQQSSEAYLQMQEAITAGRIRVDENNQPRVKLYTNNSTEAIAEGQLLFNEVTVDPSTSSIALRAKFDNPQRRILPGMFVTAEIATGTLTNVLLAPQTGVSRDPRGRAVAMLVNAEGEVEQRYIEVRETSGSHWIVRSGLEAGDKIIVEGLQKVQPGATVQTEEVK
ncbi:efflux RND transporter periplasmic adaptor subunit [Pseudidiomarina terrestris]|uniref:Efflux RND transporter periplasmic adaptor subunit n=1 Tax=Pseudidiomarina terrestris TaxID=2820060 RepID=A0ABT8MF70_9GAMM|nr:MULTISPECIES: efflux RND transporter periplasmic adaptor subunit [unclassified Pseudidiomarina]MDN7128513.1 efflux RND transporter periplasmic adaptor subunit [Pseudidiomarina sp. 1APR75-15]MDN7135239.1 efflux RND transporter periplasmic adaptor subunit [Pseudidiomarina sp. 1ASP75-5]MEA3586991.1 efflux RND transporter periplasmic adaptor subunit [Pseudidiomarina sp. 1APP75-27a]